MNTHIKFVGAEHSEQINAIRMQEYAQASGFDLDLKTLEWKQSDSDSFVMAAEQDGAVISTMRGEVISEQSLLEKKLECTWNFPLQLEFPILLLSRAATLSSHRSSGMNLVLRYWFLKLAEFHQIPFVLGTFVSGSPREQSLREMGYEFFENKEGWKQSTYRSLRPVYVVALDMRNKGVHALNYCLKRADVGLRNFSVQGEFPTMKYVRGL